MTEFWCPKCEEYRENYVDDDDTIRGIECGHELEAKVHLDDSGV